MIKGFKCEFCDEFSENKTEIELHENECSFNPKSQCCYTCKNYYPNSYHSEHCELSIISDSEFYKYMKTGNCPKYKSEK